MKLPIRTSPLSILILLLALCWATPALAATATPASTTPADTAAPDALAVLAVEAGTPEAVDLQGNVCRVRPPQRDCVCALYYDPVCGCDGKTYSNPCFASCQVLVFTEGACDS